MEHKYYRLFTKNKIPECVGVLHECGELSYTVTPKEEDAWFSPDDFDAVECNVGTYEKVMRDLRLYFSSETYRFDFPEVADANSDS